MYPLITTPLGVTTLTEVLSESRRDPVALDCETTGLDPARDEARLLQLVIGEEVAIVDLFALPDPKADLAPLFAVLAQREIVGHNIVAFDLPFLARLGFSPTRLFDTAIASRTVYAGENGKHGLVEAVQRLELGVAVGQGRTEERLGPTSGSPLTTTPVRRGRCRRTWCRSRTRLRQRALEGGRSKGRLSWR